MKKTLLILGLFAFAAHATAQTKRISHRSHSGSNQTLSMKGDGNFGLPQWYPPVVDSSLRLDTTAVDSLHRASILYHQIPGTGIAGRVSVGITKISLH